MHPAETDSQCNFSTCLPAIEAGPTASIAVSGNRNNYKKIKWEKNSDQLYWNRMTHELTLESISNGPGLPTDRSGLPFWPVPIHPRSLLSSWSFFAQMNLNKPLSCQAFVDFTSNLFQSILHVRREIKVVWPCQARSTYTTSSNAAGCFLFKVESTRKRPSRCVHLGTFLFNCMPRGFEWIKKTGAKKGKRQLEVNLNWHSWGRLSLWMQSRA